VNYLSEYLKKYAPLPGDHPQNLQNLPAEAEVESPVPPAEIAVPTPQAPSKPSKPTAPWDQAEADRLLAELRSQVERITRQDFAGTLPHELANVLADAVAIGEDLVTRHEQKL
jgi:hypothetical protein